MGVDAAHAGNADTYNFTYQLSEQDMIRNVMELGTPVGLLYCIVRLSFFSAWLFCGTAGARGLVAARSPARLFFFSPRDTSEISPEPRP